MPVLRACHTAGYISGHTTGYRTGYRAWHATGHIAGHKTGNIAAYIASHISGHTYHLVIRLPPHWHEFVEVALFSPKISSVEILATFTSLK